MPHEFRLLEAVEVDRVALRAVTVDADALVLDRARRRVTALGGLVGIHVVGEVYLPLSHEQRQINQVLLVHHG
jgi:hypothetical protein